jgi:hypothetical protein
LGNLGSNKIVEFETNFWKGKVPSTSVEKDSESPFKLKPTPYFGFTITFKFDCGICLSILPDLVPRMQVLAFWIIVVKFVVHFYSKIDFNHFLYLLKEQTERSNSFLTNKQ